MPIISIHHRTTYRYRNRVGFGEHRMMLRPIEAFDQRLLSFNLEISPEPHVLHHLHDATGSCVGVARFERRSQRLAFESRAVIDHALHAPLALETEDAAIDGGVYAYDEDVAPELLNSIQRRCADAGEVHDWARGFLRPVGRTRLSAILSDMTHAIRADFDYRLRLSGAPQAPAETLKQRSGSCRDFALLMMEAARSLGMAARFASGYLYSSDGATKTRASKGHTHAWARVFLPDCGWTDFDPTNGLIGNEGLIRVAVATSPRAVLPLHGTYHGLSSDYLGMDVEVDVLVDPDPATQPLANSGVAATG
ncbi:MAG TPA: transglutaminase family protein [Caulobacteraceae bacterium]|jgi:transglutaminase-like putative cysteine protease|nr:transglutaminase family protein [Caulobacteraceae bacterium]